MWVFVKLILGTIRERGNYCIQVCLSFIQHKSPRIACNLEVSFFSSCFDIGICFEGHESVYFRSLDMK